MTLHWEKLGALGITSGFDSCSSSKLNTFICGNNYKKGGDVQKLNEKE